MKKRNYCYMHMNDLVRLLMVLSNFFLFKKFNVNIFAFNLKAMATKSQNLRRCAEILPHIGPNRLAVKVLILLISLLLISFFLKKK